MPLLLRSNGPLYRQAAARLRASIVDGALPVGTALPTEAALAADFGISLITVRHALRDLQSEGFVRKRSAKAAVVASRAPALPASRQLNSLGDVVAATHGARLQISGYRRETSVEAAELFGLPAESRLYCLRGRLLTDGKPLSEITIFFPPSIGARLRRENFDDVVVFRSVERQLGIRLASARITVGAELADARLAQRLGIDPGAAVLVSRMLYRAEDGNPVELTIARHRADRYSLSYEVP